MPVAGAAPPPRAWGVTVDWIMLLIDAAIVVVGLFILVYWVLGITRIGSDRVGLVEKRVRQGLARQGDPRPER